MASSITSSRRTLRMIGWCVQRLANRSFYAHHTATTATSTPEAATRRGTLSGSPVRITAFWRMAVVTTSVDHIRGSALPRHSPCFVSLGFIKRNHGATGQESPELNLFRRTADLGHDRHGNGRNESELETRFVIRPCRAISSVRCDQDACIVHKGAHAGRRTRVAA